jgi:hypothetical protein
MPVSAAQPSAWPRPRQRRYRIGAGVILGGVLTSEAGWRWVFAINVPIGATLLSLGSTPGPGLVVRPGPGEGGSLPEGRLGSVMSSDS